MVGGWVGGWVGRWERLMHTVISEDASLIRELSTVEAAMPTPTPIAGPPRQRIRASLKVPIPVNSSSFKTKPEKME